MQGRRGQWGKGTDTGGAVRMKVGVSIVVKEVRVRVEVRSGMSYYRSDHCYYK